MNRMNGTSTSLELIDPSPPESLIPDPAVPAWWIAAAAVAIVLLAIGLWTLLRRRPGPANPAAVREAAFNEAAQALAEITTSDVRSGATQCSLVLRHYLAKASGDPALFETHEEFISRHDSLKDLTESARTAARSGFEYLVLLKYSRATPPVPAGEVTAGCGRLLETLHRGFTS